MKYNLQLITQLQDEMVLSLGSASRIRLLRKLVTAKRHVRQLAKGITRCRDKLVKIEQRGHTKTMAYELLRTMYGSMRAEMQRYALVDIPVLKMRIQHAGGSKESDQVAG